MTRTLPALLLCSLVCTAAVVAGCGKSAPPPPASPPATFLWGTATAAHQIEGGLHQNDFWQWQQAGHIQTGDSADDGPDGWNLQAQDVALMQAMGHTAYRFSIEWSRVEPVEGVWDEAALAHYSQLLDLLRAAKITPVVTLIHYTLPTWVQDLNALDVRPGWRGLPTEPLGQARIVAQAAKFAGEMGRRFGDRVDWWITLNEPMVLAAGGWLNGLLPPGRFVDFLGVQAAVVNQIYAHAAMADALRESDLVDADGDGKPTIISVAAHLRIFKPNNPAVSADVRGAGQLARVFNDMFLDACVRGDLDVHFDGKYDAPGGRGSPNLANRLDFIGINYYSRSVVIGTEIDAPKAGITLYGLPSENADPSVPHSDLGWEIYPQGLHDLVQYDWIRYGLPILITENGISDATDAQRPQFLVDHLLALQQAMREGADVRGYLHWSLYDNFEWDNGYSAHFGLAAVDRKSAQKTRLPRGSAALYSRIIAAHGVTKEIAASVRP